MKRIFTLVAIAALALGAMTATGCVVDDSDPAAATCDDFDYYMATCSFSCGATWDCELNYDDQPVYTQDALDDCSITLADLADIGECDPAYYTDGEYGCLLLLQDALGLSCGW